MTNIPSAGKLIRLFLPVWYNILGPAPIFGAGPVFYQEVAVDIRPIDTMTPEEVRAELLQRRAQQLAAQCDLEARLEQQRVSTGHALDQFQLEFRRERRLMDQLGQGGTNERYRWTSGELNLILQYVIHDYLPATDDNGRPVDDQHLHDFGWTLINLLDGELDHGVYHLDQVLEEVCKGLGWDEQTDLNWWLRYGNDGLTVDKLGQPTPGSPSLDSVLETTEVKLKEALEFNLQELRRRVNGARL